MNCPDWKQLLADREAHGEDPEIWSDAIAHLETCEACRASVFRLDPTLWLRDLPEEQLSDDEGQQMVTVVDSLLRRRRRRLRGWMTMTKRVAAAAVLVGATLLFVPGRQGGDASVSTEPSPASQGAGFSRVLPAESGGTPLQTWHSNSARVYEMDTPEMAFVMVVDDSLPLESR